jgi:OmpA-OmpF porin, OOP family
MKLGALVFASIAAVGCRHAKVDVAVSIPVPKVEPKPAAVEPVKKAEPPPEPPKPTLVEATTTGAQIDVPGTIEFERDKASLRHAVQGAMDTLENVRKILADNPAVTRVRIEGHTDDDGPERTNQKLSEDRARTVLKWLVSKGIDEKRLLAVGCASRDPLLPNSSEDNKQRNRRTEFDIEEIDGKQPADYTPPCTANPKRR